MQMTHETQRATIRELLRDGTSPAEIAARLELPGDVVRRHVLAIQEELRPEFIRDQVHIGDTPAAEPERSLGTPTAETPEESSAETGRHRRRYAAEARQQALALYRQGDSVQTASQRLGVPFGTINGWFHSFRSDLEAVSARQAAARGGAPSVPHPADPPPPEEPATPSTPEPAPEPTPAAPAVLDSPPEVDRAEAQLLKLQLELSEIRLEAASELRETLRVIRRQAENPPPATLPPMAVALLAALPPAGAPFPQRAQWQRTWEAMVDFLWPEGSA